MEPFYPLHVYVCDRCFLVQLEEYVSPEHIFTEYAYFSSYADSWVEHMRRYADMITDRLGLGPDSFVVEVASNDGYLLQHFVRKGIRSSGIEPAANVAKVAEEKGIPTLVKFFGEQTARELAAAGEEGGPDLRGQRARAGSATERLREGARDPAEARAASSRSSSRTSCGSWRRTSSTPSTTSTSPTSPSYAAEKIFAATGWPLRRRGDAHPRRLAARLRAPRRRRVQPGDRARQRAPTARRATPASLRLETYAGLRRAGRRRPSASSSSS